MKTRISCNDPRSSHRMVLSVAWLLLTPLAAVPNAAVAETLTVRVENLFTSSGHVLIALYDNANAFQSGDDKALRREKLPVDDSLEVVWALDGLTPGDYGVALFHDIDGDEVLNRNFVGMPKEPYGFSNNARGTFGPPDFEAITFAFDGQPLTITIQPK